MTINTIRPNSDIYSTGGITGVGGAVTISGGTSDNNDASGGRAVQDNAYIVMGLTDPPALASNQRVKAWRMRARVARTAADLGHFQTARGRLRDAANTLGAYDEWRYASSAVVKEFIGPWRPNGPGNKPFTTAINNGLRFELSWPTRTGGANEWLEVRELFVDLDFNTQPVVSAVDLTGYTATSFPDVIFTYADTELDPQVRYRAKIFAQPDTIVAGFNPETSTLAAWDSGEVTGNAQSITPTKSLKNGTAYIPYVKAAQSWNGPEGPYWWSAWVAGATARTVSLTPPAAPTVSLLHLTTLPDYRVLHDVTAGSPGGGVDNTIQIQVLEKCFRDRGPFYNWAHPQIQSCGGVTVGIDGFYTRQAAFLSSLPIDGAAPETGKVGARMISWLPTVGAFSGLDFGLDKEVTTDEQPSYLWPAIPAMPMRLSLWARTRSGTFVTRLHHLSVNATNVPVSDIAGPSTTLTSSWQRLETTFSPSPSAIYGRGHIENVTPSTGVEVLLHGIQVGPDLGAGQQLQGGIGKYLAFPPDSSWVDVRSREIMSGIASGSHVYVIDNEVIPGRPVIYRARSVTTVSGQSVVGPWVYYNNYEPPPATTLLRDPYEKENVLILKRDGRAPELNDEDFAVWHASGRNEDPMTLSGWRGGQDGSMKLAWESALEKKIIRDLVRSTRPLLVQWFDGGATYVRFMNRGYEVGSSSSGFFNGDYIETERP